MTIYSDDLITVVKRDAFLTTAQSNFTDAELLSIGDGRLRAMLIPLLMSEREGWFRVYEDQSFVANQADYTIPQYAMFGKLESVQYLDNTAGRLLPFQLTRIEVENLGDLLPTNTTGTPRFYTLNSYAITVYPTPSVAVDGMRIWYDQRPGNLVLQAAAAQVLSVNTSSGLVTYTATVPTTFTSSSPMDFYNGSSPYQLRKRSTPSAKTGTTQTFPAADVATLVAGDWVCLRGQAVFLPMPEELLPYLSDMVIGSLARTQQDNALYQTQQQQIATLAKAALSASGNRQPGNPKKIRITNPLVRNRSIPRYR